MDRDRITELMFGNVLLCKLLPGWKRLIRSPNVAYAIQQDLRSSFEIIHFIFHFINSIALHAFH